jgi:hypothetical protein
MEEILPALHDEFKPKTQDIQPFEALRKETTMAFPERLRHGCSR